MAADLLVTIRRWRPDAGRDRRSAERSARQVHHHAGKVMKYAEFMNDAGRSRIVRRRGRICSFPRSTERREADAMTAPLLSVDGVTLSKYRRPKGASGHRDLPRQLQSVSIGSIRGAGSVGMRQIDAAESGRRISYSRPKGASASNGAQVTGPGPDRVFVFQEFDQLLPWKTVQREHRLRADGQRESCRAAGEERACTSSPR